MKILLFLLFCTQGLFAQDINALSKEFFTSHAPYMHTAVISTERVFVDEYAGLFDVYEVTYTVDTGNCYGDTRIDHCEQSDPICEFVKIDTSVKRVTGEDIHPTGHLCYEGIDVVLDAQLIDDY